MKKTLFIMLFFMSTSFAMKRNSDHLDAEAMFLETYPSNFPLAEIVERLMVSKTMENGGYLESRYWCNGNEPEVLLVARAVRSAARIEQMVPMSPVSGSETSPGSDIDYANSANSNISTSGSVQSLLSEISELKCTKCSFVGVTVHRLRRHIQGKHGKKKYVCGECGFSTSHQDGLPRHKFRVHKQNCPYPCDYDECPFSARSQYRLRRHQAEVHLGIKRQRCEKCGAIMSRTENLKRHEREVHGGEQRLR